VRYFDGGRWPTWPDGDGPSLELRDPFADNSRPEAWAASDETGSADWQQVVYRGPAGRSAVGPDGQWHEFVLGLLDAGEVLLDDIEVIEDPDGAALSVLPDGTFEGGAADWRFLGTHRQSAVVPDPNDPANAVLHMIATGATEHMHNHVEVTLRDGPAIAADQTYEIRLRARWLAGSNQLNTRLYFNRLARTTRLDRAPRGGTPGAPNSTRVADLGPTFAQLRHTPAVPAPDEAVTVSVFAADPDGVAAVTLYSAADDGPFAATPMAVGEAGRYEATLPGRPAATRVQFYVEAQDTRGATSLMPAAGPDSRALYIVDDGRAPAGPVARPRPRRRPCCAAASPPLLLLPPLPPSDFHPCQPPLSHP
ncbi:MAG: hypothetical protein KC620_26220, partial [Myxococcales bacterium]|nr:hypothetical protein [Myxococcales bacterium]